MSIEGNSVNCRHCGGRLTLILDLGHQPPSNALLDDIESPEMTYPLRFMLCEACGLAQLSYTVPSGLIFNDKYPYYSSQSPSNVSHAKEFADIMCERFSPETVLEIGSNDGYLLQWFQAKGSTVIGIDPAGGPQKSAHARGIPTILGFFRSGYAGQFDPKPNLICGINVLAHQPDINDFVKGLKLALAPKGVIVMECPDLSSLIYGCQFDTIYHEHHSYFSLTAVNSIFFRYGLRIFDVEWIPEHGGSLRIYAGHIGDHIYSPSTPEWNNVEELMVLEGLSKIDTLSFYKAFVDDVRNIRQDMIKFIYTKKKKKICAYGAAAKGNTLLNYCGIKKDVIPFVVDRSPHKQGKYLPGSHIRITDESELKAYKPKYVLILPWNLADEIMEQLSYIREWGGKFLIPVPEVKIV